MSTRILLVGNAPYRNRGCEAIVRGTVAILEETFGPDLQIPAGVMGAPATVEAQRQIETDPRVQAFSISSVGPRGSLKWVLSQANARLGTDFQHHVWDLESHVGGVQAALQVGGDNYSLDYNGPWPYMAVDRALQKRGIPVVLWGASVGPFDASPKRAEIFEHLRGLNGIFVREPKTIAYLAENGVEANVHKVADSAFMMVPKAPPEQLQALVQEGAVGINLSPLVARFSGSGSDLDRWRARATEMVKAVAKLTGRPILLVPHVGAPKPEDDDFAFLESIRQGAAPDIGTPLDIVPDGLGAEETKWLIARCAVFAGARTHATIAAMSTCVPTLSLSYSVKAIGINEDMFGHQEFCRSVKEIAPEAFAQDVKRLLDDEAAIRAHLQAEVPRAKARAVRAGTLLKDIALKGRSPAPVTA